MYLFSGFSEGQTHTIAVPDEFFKDLLAHIDDLGELKVAIYAFYLLYFNKGNFKYLRQADYLKDKAFMEDFPAPNADECCALEQALERNVQRGFFLVADLKIEGKMERLYFLNTERGRAALKAIESGAWRATGKANQPVDFEAKMTNIFRLYEEHVGPLTPLISESLAEAESQYSPEWIQEAFQIAVEKNIRNWRYISRILERWKKEGKLERKDRQDTEEARQRYAEWENPRRNR
jgi:DNA replication protein